MTWPVFDQDAGRWSHELIARIDGANFTDEIIPAQGLRELNELIIQRRALIGVHIAADFSRKLAAAKQAQVQLLVDGRRANAGQVAVNYFGAIAEELNVELAVSAEEGGKAPQLRLRHWFNPNLNYRWFMVVNVCGAITLMLTLVVTALSIAREREMGTFDQLLVAPLNSFEVIIAKSVPGHDGRWRGLRLGRPAGGVRVRRPLHRQPAGLPVLHLFVSSVHGRHRLGDFRPLPKPNNKPFWAPSSAPPPSC